MRLIAICMLALCLSGCGEENSHGELGKQNSEAVTTNESKEYIGRFAYYPPAGEMPAVLLDTVTGCVEVFEKATSLDNPKDVAWWRHYADTPVPLVTYVNGKAKEVPNSAPPHHCPNFEESTK
jgi:hypothetical protein